MKYWAYMNNEILGPFEKKKLFELPGFEASSLICPQTPVGEKTEDWKEASTCPEMALMFNSPAPSTPGAPDIQVPLKEQSPSPIPAADSPPKAEQASVTPPRAADGGVTGGTETLACRGPMAPSAAETPEEIKFKPLSASSLEPAAPPPSPLENIGIEVNPFGALKSDGKIEHPVTELARSAAASFDSLSLSQIRKKTDFISAAGSPPPGLGGEQASVTPPPASGPGGPAEVGQAGGGVTAPAVGNQDLESTNFSAAGQPPSQPEISENPASPAAVDTAALEVLSSKMQTLCETALTRQELNSQLEPLRQKLERMGEAPASTDAVQFQHALLAKLGYLEEAVSEIKFSLSAAAGGKTTQTLQMKEKAKAEAPKKENKQAEIVDTGRKSIRSGLFFKKASKFLVTLLLIAAVALVAVFGLKQFMGFDATRFIPFPIPFLTDNKAAPASAAQSPAEQPQSTETSAKPFAPGQPAAPVKAEPIPPEVIYFIHTYALRPGALTLENAIRQEAAKAGWDSDKLNWENCAQAGNTPEAGKFQAAPGAYAIAAVIPSKDGKNRLSFFYEVDTKLATVKPLDEIGKTAMEILISASVLKTQPKPGLARQTTGGSARQTQRAPAGARTKTPAKTQTRQTAPLTQTPPKQTPPSDEYEYVDEEEQ